MPRPCPRTVDAPFRILGLEWDDWVAVSTVLMFFLLVWSPAVAGFVLPALVIGMRTLKRGQPPGIILHRLWLWRLVELKGFPPPPDRNGSLWSPWA